MKFNLIKKILRLFRRQPKLKLTQSQIDELIDRNKKILEQLGDEADYDGMGNYGRFPPIKKNEPKR